MEAHMVPELLSISTMGSFYLSILRRFTRINEIMDHTKLLTRSVKHMNLWMRRISAFLVSGVVIGEYRTVICFNTLNLKRSRYNHFSLCFFAYATSISMSSPGEVVLDCQRSLRINRLRFVTSFSRLNTLCTVCQWHTMTYLFSNRFAIFFAP